MAMNSKANRDASVAPTVGAEMRKMAAEPLLPIEKKLIGWSLGLGIVLLVVLVTIAKMVLPAS
jgi:hypothetical protein